ncbi:MAG: hypothetical protein K0S28_1319 [Paucimonas sp.]|nr:hypothetical protein [Paucimonas sp.]
MAVEPADPAKSSRLRRSGASAFARVALVVYALLVTYASWYPFSGWRKTGIPPFDFLDAPFPYYWTKFDIITNVIGYAPLGLLVVLALYPYVRGIAAAILATVGGFLLSGLMETVQNYLPNRVASNLDLGSNTAGALIGAVIAVSTTRYFMEESRLVTLRQKWFSAEAGRGLMVILLWPLAQIYPLDYLFGHGQLLPILSGWIGKLLEEPFDPHALIFNSHELTVQQYWLAETVITACGLTGAVLTLLCMLRHRSPKAILATAMIGGALCVRSLASALQFSPEHAFAWLTPGAQGGLLLGAVMLSGLVFAPVAAQRRVAALTLVMSLTVVNAVPPNPYFAETLQAWTQGKFINFNGAANFLSLCWPFIALWFLTHRVHKKKSDVAPEKNEHHA